MKFDLQLFKASRKQTAQDKKNNPKVYEHNDSPKSYHCSNCGAAAYYDGRCGDGPILMCGCGPHAVSDW